MSSAEKQAHYQKRNNAQTSFKTHSVSPTKSGAAPKNDMVYKNALMKTPTAHNDAAKQLSMTPSTQY